MAEYCAAESSEPRGPSHSGQRPHPILWAMPAVVLAVGLVLLAVSLPPALVYLPDAILTLVRLTVSFCAALIAYATWRKNAAWSLAFAALGLLYNPVLTINLRDDVWVIAHSAALLLFVLHWTALGAKLSRAP
jgi:hypothetical protein